jgi:hypothetical protein
VPKTTTPKKPSAKSRNGKPLAHHAALARALVTDNPPAIPLILQPQAGDFVTPGTILRVLMSTNRPDLRYVIQVIDITDPMNPGAPQQMNLPAPLDHFSTRLFAADLPGAWFLQDHKYQIRVFVDPADGNTPPHLDATIDVTCVQPIWWFVTTTDGNGTVPVP